MKKVLLTLMLLFTCCPLPAQQAGADAPLLTFNRGKLWHSIYMGKSGPGSFDNWRKNGIGWDWPGFDASRVRENIGGAPSYMASGGLYIGCKKSDDSVLAFEDWAMYAPGVSNEPTAKFLVREHRKTDNNHFLRAAKRQGEEVISTVWEYNTNFPNTFEPQRQLPLRVRRTAHQWSGSSRDENYIIYEYVIKNIAAELRPFKDSRKIVDSLYDFYTMLSYAIHCNSRSWSVLFPTQLAGARNTRYTVDSIKPDYYTGARRKMMYAYAGDYRDPETNNSLNVVFGRSLNMGQKIWDPIAKRLVPSGEWLSPGMAGFRLLYSTPDKLRNTAGAVNKFGWSAVENNQDLAGPVTGKSGQLEALYKIIKDPANAYNPVTSEGSPLMGTRRIWSMMSLGPWNLFPGDSVVIVVAEIVDGIDYSRATGPDIFPLGSTASIIAQARDQFERSSDKAQFTFDNGFDHPDPPPAPAFTVNYWRGGKSVGNIIAWRDSCESVPDPDDNLADLAGYRVYRSEYLPIGPWVKIADIRKGDPSVYVSGSYTFLDTSVQVGTSYYYSLTAYDSGRAFWPVNPAARFRETGTTRVPLMESSLYANRLAEPFTATLEPQKSVNNILVVPNPFVIGEGSAQPGEQDVIQFVNVPAPCTVRIFNVRGDLVKTLYADDRTGGIISWNQATDYGQFVQSGVYIYHVESPYGNATGKFAIVR